MQETRAAAVTAMALRMKRFFLIIMPPLKTYREIITVLPVIDTGSASALANDAFGPYTKDKYLG